MSRIVRFVVHPARLLTAPRLGSVRREGGSTTVAIEGLVCSVCASRTRVAFARMPGVEAVDVDLERGEAVLRHHTPLDRRALSGALDSIVVLPGARRLLDRLAHRVRLRLAGRAV